MRHELYEEHAALERDQWWFVGRRAILKTVLDRHLPATSDRQILDVGCGTGGMLPLLAGFGVVRGIEPEPLAVAHCRSTFSGFEVQLGGIPADVPSDGRADVVTAFDVIEHLDDDLAALRSLRAALGPDGTLVLTVPALAWLWSDHDVVNGHRRRYTRRSLLDVTRRAGFEVSHLSYFNSLLLPAVAAARLVQRVRPRSATPHSDFTMPGPVVNRVLTAVLSTERRAVAGRGLPLGVSLVLVARCSTPTLPSTII